jgi:hypothetical protein
VAFHVSSSGYRYNIVFDTGYPEVMTRTGQIIQEPPDIHMAGTD